MLSFRRAVPADKARIFEISSQVWDGGDYIEAVFDEWVKDTVGEFTVAEYGGTIAGFAKYTKISRKEIWLEGIRVDTAYAGRGFGSQMTEYYIKKAMVEGAEVIRLSTYKENLESISILEKYSFKKDGYFTFAEKKLAAPLEVKPASNIVNIMSTATAWELITKRSAYVMSNGYISFGWLFKKLTYELIDSLVKGKKVYGVLSEGNISSILILGEDSHKDGGMCISYLDGNIASMKKLIDFALYEAERSAAPYLSVMAPVYEEMIDALEMCEFDFLHDKYREVNVFVYSKTL